jgi:hypothetical protein
MKKKNRLRLRLRGMDLNDRPHLIFRYMPVTERQNNLS